MGGGYIGVAETAKPHKFETPNRKTAIYLVQNRKTALKNDPKPHFSKILFLYYTYLLRRLFSTFFLFRNII